MVFRFFFKMQKNIFRPASTFKLTDYDVIGLDLDNTLLQYNLTNFYNLQYSYLVNYLTEKKGYNKAHFSVKPSENDIDFIQRGLFIDIGRGNILNLRNDGYILKASHGTKEMDNSLIKQFYGPDRKWTVTNKFLNDLLLIWDSSETRTFLDYTDSIATLLFAKAVDSVDLHKKPSTYQVWPDLLEAIVEMYKTDSTFYQTISSSVSEYLKPCDKDVLKWLKSMKDNAKLILITGAEYEVAQETLPICLGQDYKDYFDLIIYNAKKPGFFNLSRPFLSLHSVPVSNVVLGNEYKHGNWSSLYKILASGMNKFPKCLYIGDNPLQDIFAPTKIPEALDVVALIEEVAGEGLFPGYEDSTHSKCVTSKFWGSFLYCDNGYTFIGGIIKHSAKLVIPSLKLFAEKPLDYQYTSILRDM